MCVCEPGLLAPSAGPAAAAGCLGIVATHSAPLPQALGLLWREACGKSVKPRKLPIASNNFSFRLTPFPSNSCSTPPLLITDLPNCFCGYTHHLLLPPPPAALSFRHFHAGKLAKCLGSSFWPWHNEAIQLICVKIPLAPNMCMANFWRQGRRVELELGCGRGRNSCSSCLSHLIGLRPERQINQPKRTPYGAPTVAQWLIGVEIVHKNWYIFSFFLI